MMPFKRPLVALSLTEPDAGLLAYVAMVSSWADYEEFRFVHVASEGQTEGMPSKTLHERMHGQVLEHFGTPRCAVQLEIAHGPRLDQLISAVVRNRNDVVLLGHRSARSGQRALARRLAMAAPASVWLVPEGSPPTLNHILAPVDFSEPSADALSVAAAIAAARGLPSCTALHVFFDSSTVRYDEHLAEVRGREHELLAQLVAASQHPGIRVEPVLEESEQTPRAILRVAQQRRCDLIVMSTRGRSRAAAVLLGSITSKTMAETSTPLLAVKHQEARMGLLQALINHRFWEGSAPKTN